MLLGRVSPKYLPGSLVGSSDPLSNVASGINRVSCFHMCELHTVLLYLSNPFQFLICSPVVSVDWTGETLLKEYINLTHVTKLVGCMLRTTQPCTSSKNHELRDNYFQYFWDLFSIISRFLCTFFLVDSDCWVGGSWGLLIIVLIDISPSFLTLF